MAQRSDIRDYRSMSSVFYPFNYIHISRVNILWNAFGCYMRNRLRFMSTIAGRGSVQLPFVCHECPRTIFGVTRVFLGRRKPGCLIVRRVTMFCPTGLSAVRTLRQLVSPVTLASNNPFADNCKDILGGLRDTQDAVACPVKCL